MESWIESELQRAGLSARVEMYVDDVWLISFSGQSLDLDDLAKELEFGLKKYFAGNGWYWPYVFVSDVEPNALEVYIGD